MFDLKSLIVLAVFGVVAYYLWPRIRPTVEENLPELLKPKRNTAVHEAVDALDVLRKQLSTNGMAPEQVAALCDPIAVAIIKRPN